MIIFTNEYFSFLSVMKRKYNTNTIKNKSYLQQSTVFEAWFRNFFKFDGSSLEGVVLEWISV